MTESKEPEKKNFSVRHTDSLDGFSTILNEEVIIDRFGTKIYFRSKPFLLYFIKVVFVSFCISIPSILVGTALSFLQWDNIYTRVSLMFSAMYFFGGFIAFYFTMICGKGIWTLTKIIIFLSFALFWPITLVILLVFGIPIWFYYLDFLYFFFGFTPMSLIAGWSITQNDRTLTVLFGIAELITIVGALAYTFFLFPIFTRISDLGQFFWAVIFHPLFFEVFLALAPRILIKLKKDTNPNFAVLASHAMFHNCTIGKMVLFSIRKTWVLVLAIIFTSAFECLDRITLFDRDKMLLKRLARVIKSKNINDCEVDPKKDEEEEIERVYLISSHLLNTKMAIEFSGILISFAMMMLFARHGDLFSFNTTDNKNMVIALSIQLVFAVIINFICSVYEVRYKTHDLLVSWNQLFKIPFVLFIVYGNCFMGLLGMLYVTLQLSRPF